MTNNKQVAKTDTHLETLVTEGIKLATSQEAVNAVSVATFAKTFLNLDDKQAAALGVGYALISQHLEKKDGAF